MALVVAGALAGPWLWRRRRPRLRRRRFAPTGLAGHRDRGPLGTGGLGPRPHRSRPPPLGDPGRARRPPGGPGRPFDHRIGLRRSLRAWPRPRTPEPSGPSRPTGPWPLLAAQASYAAEPPTPADLAEARRLSDELRQALRQGAPVGARVGVHP